MFEFGLHKICSRRLYLTRWEYTKVVTLLKILTFIGGVVYSDCI